MKPTIDQIEAYAKSKGLKNYSIAFMAKMELKEWKTSNGTPVKDWQTAYRFFVKRHEADLEFQIDEADTFAANVVLFGIGITATLGLLSAILYLTLK